MPAGERRSGPNEVVHLEGAALGGKPFLARRRPPPSALVERQLEVVDQPQDLLLHAQMRGARRGAGLAFPERVKGGEAARKQLAIDDPLGKSIDAAKSEPGRQLLEALAHQTVLARSDLRHAI